MKVKILIGLLVFLIVVNLATIGSYVYLQLREPPASPRWQRPVPPAGLELDRRQRDELRNMLEEFRENTKVLRTRIRLLEDEIFELLQRDTVPADSIDNKLEEIAAIRLEISRKIVENFRETKQVLSPAQQAHFYKLLTQARPEIPGIRPGPPGDRPEPDRRHRQPRQQRDRPPPGAQ